MISTSIKEGERIYHRQAGGGGWGNPLERSPQAVERDVRNDKVSVASRTAGVWGGDRRADRQGRCGSYTRVKGSWESQLDVG